MSYNMIDGWMDIKIYHTCIIKFYDDAQNNATQR